MISSAELERRISACEGVSSLIEAARVDGASSIWESGLAHIDAGETTLEELLRVAERPAEEAVAHSPMRYHSPAANSKSVMTQIKAGVVSVYVLARDGKEWRVLALQRAEHTRCPGSWEAVHGKIEDGEKPEDAAVRELAEETGLKPERLYSVTVNAFYIHREQTVQLSMVFAAVVGEPLAVTLGEEHVRHDWPLLTDAAQRFAWPREREALAHISVLLFAGDAGPLEDVLRII